MGVDAAGAEDSPVVALTRALVERPSITPNDAGCQALIAARLQEAGFAVEQRDFGQVRNLWATHGTGTPVVCLLGHTDVVPPGPRERWSSEPFVAEVRDGMLHGRGAADMKGSVAAFVCALETLVAEQPRHPGTLVLLLTSDEEGDAIDGVRRVAVDLAQHGPRIDYCLVGEPSSSAALGDVVRVGRRGSLTGTVTVFGVQGHVAYPDLAVNPIHRALPVLQSLVERRWDAEPYPDFPPTSFQIANFNAGTGASNVVPGTACAQFNLRYSPHWTSDALVEVIGDCFEQQGVEAVIDWHRSGEPFYTAPGALRDAVRCAVADVLGRAPEENTGGGTSDGRFIAPLGAEVVELGPINASIHKVDEHIALADLERLPALYAQVVRRLWQCEAQAPPGAAWR